MGIYTGVIAYLNENSVIYMHKIDLCASFVLLLFL